MKLNLTRLYENRLDQLRVQELAAAKLMTELSAYAESIGCELFQDEIACSTQEQSRKLADWWIEHTSKPAAPAVVPKTILDGYANLIGIVQGITSEIVAKRVPCKLEVIGHEHSLVEPIKMGPTAFNASRCRLAFFDTEIGGHWRFEFVIPGTPSRIEAGHHVAVHS